MREIVIAHSSSCNTFDLHVSTPQVQYLEFIAEVFEHDVIVHKLAKLSKSRLKIPVTFRQTHLFLSSLVYMRGSPRYLMSPQ